MYPRNAASPPRIGIGAVVQISDGAVQTSGVSISVLPEGGASGAGGGTTTYENGIVVYAPTQGETNYTAFVVVAYKTGCIPVAQTVVTTASSTAGKVDVSHFGGTSVTARDIGASVLLSSGTGAGQISLSSGLVTLAGVTHTGAVIPTVTTLTGHTAQTGDCFARLGAPAGASVSADIAAAKSDTAAILDDTGTSGVVVAAASKTGYSLTATTGLGNQTADITGNLSGSVGSISGVTFPSNFSALGISAGGVANADVKYVNGTLVTGTGALGDEWGP